MILSGSASSVKTMRSFSQILQVNIMGCYPPIPLTQQSRYVNSTCKQGEVLLWGIKNGLTLEPEIFLTLNLIL